MIEGEPAMLLPVFWALARTGTPEAEALVSMLSIETADVSRSGGGSSAFSRRRALGRALVLGLLRRVGPVADWTIDVDSRGKPLAMGPQPRHISIAHSGDVVGAAVSLTGAIGIDVERRKMRDHEALAHGAFGYGERCLVASHGASAFYRIWTIREAIGKATGKGLTLAADGVDRVPLCMPDATWVRVNNEWGVAHTVVFDDVSLALACQISESQETAAAMRDFTAAQIDILQMICEAAGSLEPR